MDLRQVLRALLLFLLFTVIRLQAQHRLMLLHYRRGEQDEMRGTRVILGIRISINHLLIGM